MFGILHDVRDARSCLLLRITTVAHRRPENRLAPNCQRVRV